jgi:hypothetical protein
MAVSNITTVPAHVWIPPTTTAAYKLTVTKNYGLDNEIVDDLTDKVYLLEISDGVTDLIGNFSFELWNPDESLTGYWTGMELFRYYSDYDSVATNCRFSGYIEKISYKDNKIVLSGRSVALKFMEITVTSSYSNTYCSTIFIDIAELSGITSSALPISSGGFVEYSNTTLNVSWSNKPYMECVKELCTAAGFDAYLDHNLSWHFFPASSVKNTGEAIIHDYNLFEVSEFADDITQVKNRIIVYGANIDGVQIIYTANDKNSQTAYGVREEVVSDTSISTYDDAKDYAEFLKSSKKDPPKTGEVTGALLATIQPGEQIYLSSPDNNIQPNLYDINSYKHKIDLNRGLTTNVVVNKEPRKFTHILKNIIESSNKQQDTSVNPHNMQSSYIFTFDEALGSDESYSNTALSNGVLYASLANGYWISPTRVLDTQITEAYLVANADTMTGLTFYVSGNDGLAWEQIIPSSSKINLSSSIGTELRVKVVFGSTTPQLQSLSLMYRCS